MMREKTLFKLFPGWQVGYGAFTYHISMKSVLIKYIQNQEEHHRKISFKEEMIELLNENMIPFKENTCLSDHIYLVLQFISEGGSMITEGNPLGLDWFYCSLPRAGPWLLEVQPPGWRCV